jgi:hypothetical protein
VIVVELPHLEDLLAPQPQPLVPPAADQVLTSVQSRPKRPCPSAPRCRAAARCRSCTG